MDEKNNHEHDIEITVEPPAPTPFEPLQNAKHVTFREGSHYIQWDGVKCNRCLKMITIRAYFDGPLSIYDREVQRTVKCDCGVKILKRNGILTLIPRQIFDKVKHAATKSDNTIADVIKMNNVEKKPKSD